MFFYFSAITAFFTLKFHLSKQIAGVHFFSLIKENSSQIVHFKRFLMSYEYIKCK